VSFFFVSFCCIQYGFWILINSKEALPLPQGRPAGAKLPAESGREWQSGVLFLSLRALLFFGRPSLGLGDSDGRTGVSHETAIVALSAVSGHGFHERAVYSL